MAGRPVPVPGPRTPDPELPVLPLRHPAVLADDQRGDRLAALQRRDVDALDPPRQRRQLQRLLQPLEGHCLGQPAVLVAGPIGELGVAGRQVDQAAAVAALRDDDADPAFGPRRQPLLHHVGVFDRRRDVDLARRDLLFVELLEGRGHHRLGPAGDLVGVAEQRDPLDHPAAPHLEHLDDRPAIADRHAEDVAVAEFGGRHLLLAGAERLHHPHRVAVVRRLLEPLRRRGGAHPRRRARRPAPRCGPRAGSGRRSPPGRSARPSRARRRRARGSA